MKMTKKRFDELTDELYFKLIRLSRQYRTNKNFDDMNLNELLKIERDYNIKLNYAAIKVACFEQEPSQIATNFDVYKFIGAIELVETSADLLKKPKLIVKKCRSARGYTAYFIFDGDNKQVSEDYYNATEALNSNINTNQYSNLISITNKIEFDLQRTIINNIYVYDDSFTLDFSLTEALFYSDDKIEPRKYDFSISYEDDQYCFDDMQKQLGTPTRQFETVQGLIEYVVNRLK
ncbi:MAG: hypothetical protein ACRC17_12130 [Culicoidibacterales bacterium]